MFARWLRLLLWHPFELICRRLPLVPFEVIVEEPVPGVRAIRIGNRVTRLITWVGGGYDYSVVYVIGDELLVDTGFPWAARPLKRALIELGVDRSLTHVVNTHAHEDHVGNNDVIAAVTDASIIAHPHAVPLVRWPGDVPWYRGFMFGPLRGSVVEPAGEQLDAAGFRFDVVATPGHTADHLCLFEPDHGWLFAGDLYVDETLDAQLRDVDGPAWIASLDRALALEAQVLFDGHGTVIVGAETVRATLDAKRSFLVAVRDRTLEEAPSADTLSQLTARVFRSGSAVDHFSFHEGRLSILTSQDFARSHLVRSFLPLARTA